MTAWSALQSLMDDIANGSSEPKYKILRLVQTAAKRRLQSFQSLADLFLKRTFETSAARGWSLPGERVTRTTIKSTETAR